MLCGGIPEASSGHTLFHRFAVHLLKFLCAFAKATEQLCRNISTASLGLPRSLSEVFFNLFQDTLKTSDKLSW